MEKIQSETNFLFKFIFKILITPITFIFFLFKKRTLSDLLSPFFEFFRYLFQAKFTITIIVLNIIIYIISLFFSESLFLTLANSPNNFLNFRLYSLITSGFLHANISHLFGNILGIFIFSRVVEKKMGGLKTALIYFGALIISSTFSNLINIFITHSNIPGIGASGALMGLISTAILLNPFYITYELIIPLPIMIVGWISIFIDITGILNPIQDNIGHFAHIFGFLSIFILMFVIDKENREKLKKGFIINILSLLIFGFIIFGLVLKQI